MTKICSKCNSEKLFEDFHKNQYGKYNLHSFCKSCRVVQGQKYYKENRKSVLSRNAKYHQDNRVYRCMKASEHYQKNRESVLDRCTKYRKANTKQIANYAHNNLDKFRINNARRRAFKRNAGGRYTWIDIEILREIQDELCNYCGVDISNTQFHIEHKIPLARGGSNYPENIALACVSCNLRKHTMTDKEFIEKLKERI